MDTTFALAPNKAVSAVGVILEQKPAQIDTRVAPVQKLHGTTLPTEKPFVAQVVTARLSGTAFPENPGEIAPPDRTLRPYNVPMLPAEKVNEEIAEGEDDVDAAAEVDEKDDGIEIAKQSDQPTQLMQTEQPVTTDEAEPVSDADPSPEPGTSTDQEQA